MKYLLICILFPTFFLSSTIDKGTIHLEVQNIQKAKGRINVAIFDTEAHFLKDDKLIQGHSIPIESTENVRVSLTDLPYGTYAIAIYHDVNDNGELDTNLFGVPKEPYGFSNNARSKWGAPKYEVAKFDLQQSVLTISAKVKTWGQQ